MNSHNEELGRERTEDMYVIAQAYLPEPASNAVRDLLSAAYIRGQMDGMLLMRDQIVKEIKAI